MLKHIVFLASVTTSLSASPDFILEKRPRFYEATAEIGAREHKEPHLESPAPLQMPFKTIVATGIAAIVVYAYYYDKSPHASYSITRVLCLIAHSNC